MKKEVKLNFPVVVVLGGTIAGVVIGEFTKINLELICSVAAISIIGLVISFRKKRYFSQSIGAMALTMGLILGYVADDTNKKDNYYNRLKDTEIALFEGKITQREGKRAVVELKRAKKEKITGKVYVYFKQEKERAKEGDNILFVGQYRKIQEKANPYEFDFKRYAQNKNIFGTIWCSKYKIKQGEWNLENMLVKARGYLLQKSDELPQKQGAMVKALVLGYKKDIEKEVYNHYVDAGAVHILAISGLHIGIISAMLMQLMNLVFVSRRLKLIVVISFLWIYASLCGMSGSVVRSAIMFTFLSISIYTGRGKGGYNSVAMAALLSLIIDPNYLFDIGFQLSYSAVLAIFAFEKSIREVLEKILGKTKVGKYITTSLSLSTSAQLGVLPLSLYYFGQFPILFFVTNLFIIPMVGITLSGAMIVMLLLCLDILPIFFVKIFGWQVEIMNWIVREIARLENFIIRGIEVGEIELVAGTMAIVMLAVCIREKQIKYFNLFAMAIAMCQISGIFAKTQIQKSEALEIITGEKSVVVCCRMGQKAVVLKKEEEKANFLKEYLRKNRIEKTHTKQIKNIFEVGGRKILYVDREFYPQKNKIKVDYIVLEKNVKINLDIILDRVETKIVFSPEGYDGEKWRKSCREKAVEFREKYSVETLVN